MKGSTNAYMELVGFNTSLKVKNHWSTWQENLRPKDTCIHLHAVEEDDTNVTLPASYRMMSG